VKVITKLRKQIKEKVIIASDNQVFQNELTLCGKTRENL
jgi:hypothetical protein